MYKVVFNIEIKGESPILAEVAPIADIFGVAIEFADKPDDDDFKLVTATSTNKGDLSDFIIGLFGGDSDEACFDDPGGLEIKLADDRPIAYNNLEPVFITADTSVYQLATSNRSAEDLASEVVARAICECFDQWAPTHD
jgi:hypothetical protein